MIKGVAFSVLVGETIKEVAFGNPNTPKCGSYGAMTIVTESGKRLVIWQSMGEVNLSEEVA